MDFKICSKCSVEKPLTEYTKNKECKFGVNSYCKICKANKDKLYYTRNVSKIKNYGIDYRHKNSDKLALKREQNKEQAAKWNKDWHDRHRDDIQFKEYKRLNSLKYYHANTDVIRNKEKIKRQANPEHYKVLSKAQCIKHREKRSIQAKIYREKNKDLIAKRAYAYKQRRLKTDILFKLRERLRYRTYSILKAKNFDKNKKYKDYIGCSPAELKIHIESQFDANMNWDNYGSYWSIDHIVPLASAKTEEDVYRLCHYTNLQPLEKFENIRKSNKIVLAIT